MSVVDLDRVVRLPEQGAAATTPHETSLLVQLATALDRAAVSYCQWKGHWDPTRWMQGEGDVDLLVAREHGARLQGLLAGLGFRQAVASPGAQTPGVVSYYGFDPGIVRPVHVHVHFQVRIGDAWALNYHLPVERALLATARTGRVFRIPAPELEFIVFVLRMTLAHTARTALTAARETRRAREWEYLAGRVQQERVDQVLSEHLPAITAVLFARCVRSLSPRCSVLMQWRVARHLRRVLDAQAERTPLADALRRSLRRSSYLLRNVLGRPPRRQRLLCGGLVVAVLGGDGAGKTTAVSHVTQWLSSSIETRGMHLGKPPRSLATLGVAVARRLARWAQPRRWLGLPCPDEPVPVLLHLRALCIAHDRYASYRHARREAARGRIVICDRYPTRYIRGMDGPSTTLSAAGSSSWWTRVIRQAEARVYDRILAPELAIVLRVDPDVAVARKTDEDAAYVHARSSEVWRLDLRDAPVHVLDANRPCADVLADVRRVVWAHL